MILTESNKLRQNLKNDPIKSINNESGGSASEIVRMIALALGFMGIGIKRKRPPDGGLWE